MRYWYGLKTKPVAWLLPILAFTLVLAVACGSAAAPADTPQEPAQVQAAPTSAPAPTAAPQEATDKTDSAMMEPEIAPIYADGDGGWLGASVPSRAWDQLPQPLQLNS